MRGKKLLSLTVALSLITAGLAGCARNPAEDTYEEIPTPGMPALEWNAPDGDSLTDQPERQIASEIIREKLLCVIPLFLIVTGALQYPLSVLGNGFADNQKQLFCFSLCHDLLLGTTAFFLVSWLRGRQNAPQIQWKFRRIKGDAV